MRTKKHTKTFISAKAKKTRGLLYRKIAKHKSRPAQQALQLVVRFAEHAESLEHLKKLL